MQFIALCFNGEAVAVIQGDLAFREDVSAHVFDHALPGAIQDIVRVGGLAFSP